MPRQESAADDTDMRSAADGALGNGTGYTFQEALEQALSYGDDHLASVKRHVGEFTPALSCILTLCASAPLDGGSRAASRSLDDGVAHSRLSTDCPPRPGAAQNPTAGCWRTSSEYGTQK